MAVSIIKKCKTFKEYKIAIDTAFKKVQQCKIPKNDKLYKLAVRIKQNGLKAGDAFFKHKLITTQLYVFKTTLNIIGFFWIYYRRYRNI